MDYELRNKLNNIDKMKKILFLMMATLTIVGCSSNDEEPQVAPVPEPVKEYFVSLGFSGEITDISESPLTRTATDDLYGIQVYSMPTSGTEYKPYAYGLFDDKTKMTVKLLEGYKYKFVSTMVVNGKHEVHSNNGGYSFPFYTEGYTVNDNTFKYSSSKSFSSHISKGTVGVIINNLYATVERPNMDRYYGEVIGYSPLENGAVSINMKRVVFGVKIITDGLTEGILKITLKDSPDMVIQYPNTEIQDIFTFSNSGSYGNFNAWTSDDYTETIPLSVSWGKADGATVPLVTQDITFKRNKLTTITVKVKDNSINNGVDISQDNTPMGNGDNITIDTSNNNTEVNPT